MHDAGAQHPHDLVDQEGVMLPRLRRVEAQVVEARGRFAGFIRDQFHQQNALVKVVGRGHPHTGFFGGGEERHPGRGRDSLSVDREDDRHRVAYQPASASSSDFTACATSSALPSRSCSSLHRHCAR